MFHSDTFSLQENY